MSVATDDEHDPEGVTIAFERAQVAANLQRARTRLEDLDWAKKVIARGHLLAYCADAPIVHVHEESFAQIINRYRREAIAHKHIYDEHGMPLRTAVRLGVANIVGDARDAKRRGLLATQLPDIVRFRGAQFYGTYRGLRQRGENSLTLPFHSRIQEQKGSRDCPQDKSRWPFHNRASPALQSSTWLRPLGRIMVSGLLEMQERRHRAGGEHRIGNEMVGEFRGQRLM